MASLTFPILRKQDDLTSNAIITFLRGNADFNALSEMEGKAIVQRDVEDDAKLGVGVSKAVKRGTLPPLTSSPQVKKIDVAGRSADEIAEDVMSQLPAKEGNVIVMQGLSGTGKGTTVSKLREKLPRCVCWSNGNVFRAFTLLVSEFCESTKTEFCSTAITPEVLSDASRKLSFERFDEQFDVVISGFGRVGALANTTLKTPQICSRVPTVAEETQGEVIHFGLEAVETMRKAGCNVILEGRAQTLNYIPTPSRFELVVANPSVLGQRRAAQRVMAVALEKLKRDENASSEEVAIAVRESVAELKPKMKC